jgi:hypothetical protein
MGSFASSPWFDPGDWLTSIEVATKVPHRLSAESWNSRSSIGTPFSRSPFVGISGGRRTGFSSSTFVECEVVLEPE